MRLRHCLAYCLALLASAVAAAPARAHEGHDHGPPPAVAAALPRTEAQSDLFELVVVLGPDGAATIWLDRFTDNAPVEGAVTLTIEGQEIAAERQGIGLFVARHALLARPGTRDIVFTVSAGEEMDLLTATLEVPPAPAIAGGAAAELLALLRELPLQLGIGAGLLLLGVLLGRGSVRRPLPPMIEEPPALMPAKAGLPRRVAGLALLAMLPAATALAQVTPASLPGEAPRRLDDGAIFVPKASQRLLTIRTELAEAGRSLRHGTDGRHAGAGPQRVRSRAAQPDRPAGTRGARSAHPRPTGGARSNPRLRDAQLHGGGAWRT
jgi:membrane fusion protein, heavy metal efflux system